MKAYYSNIKQSFDNEKEVFSWIYKYVSKFGGNLYPEEVRAFVRTFEKRYEVENGESILRGLINHSANKYGFTGSFDTAYGLYNINFSKNNNK